MSFEERDERSNRNLNMSRRNFLKLLSLSGATLGAASLLAACQSAPPAQPTSPAQPAPPAQPAATSAPSGAAAPAATSAPAAKLAATAAPAAGTPKRGGTFKFPLAADVTPWPPIGVLQNLLVNKTIFDGLVRYSAEDWTPQPALAEKWEVSKDGLSWTFYLRKGVQWHDGKPFTADDVKFSMDTYMDPKVNSILRGNFEPVKAVEVVDPNTVRMVTKDPYSSLIEVLAYLAFMMPKHLLEGQAATPTSYPQDFIKKPIGTGAFKFVENVNGDHLTVTANDNYWDGKPYLDQVIFRIVRDGNSRVSQVRTGELDFGTPTEAQLSALQAPNVQVFTRGKPEFYYTGFNYEEKTFGKWFSDKRFRQAMAYAIDSKAILQGAVNGKGDLSNGPIAPAFKPWFVKDAKFYEYNPDLAGKMFADLGFKKGADGLLEQGGTKLSWTATVEQGQADRQQMALITQQNLKDIGIDYQIQALDLNDLSNRRRVTKEYVATSHQYFLPTTPDLRAYWTTGASTNEWPYSNPEVDKLFQQSGQVFEYEKRKAIFDQIYKIIAEDQPVVFHIHPLELQALNTKVKGFPPTHYRDATLYLHKVWFDS